MYNRSIDDWQGRDPSDCPETFNDVSTDDTTPLQLFLYLIFLMAVLFGGGYLMINYF